MDLFFYGTLRHPPLLELVLGAGGADLEICPATLPDYAVFAVVEGPFPTIVAQPGATAQGILVRGLSDAQIARLNFYEGSFDYDLVTAPLDGGARAQFYLSPPGRWTPTVPWSLTAWVDAHGTINQYAATEVMGYYGTLSREEVAARFPRIRARAASAARAARSVHGRDTLHGKIDVSERHRVHSDFYAFDTLKLRHERFDGTWTDTLEREVFVPSDSAMVLPYDPKRDSVLLVEQMRLGPLGRGDRRVWQWEAVAGLIDPGETPEATVIREAREEAGVEIQHLQEVARTYSSPGNSAEFSYLYVGLADLPADASGLGGLASEGEDIRSHILGFDALMQRIEEFDIANAPLVLLALWLDRNRDCLR